MTLPKFDSPPVNELVIGMVFEPIRALKSPHLGLFWQQVREDYPVCQSAAPMANGAAISWFDEATQLPLPRVWFVNKSGDELIQLQNDRFYFNWRRGDDEDLAYPSFDKLFEKFCHIRSLWDKFISLEFSTDLKVITNELTYVNLITPPTNWPATSNKLFKDFSWNSGAKRFLSAPGKLSWNTSFALPNESGQLQVRASEARRTSDNSEVLRLELAARGISQGSDQDEEFENWFKSAHEMIVLGFKDLTTEDMHKHWRIKD